MAGYEVVKVGTDAHGNVDLDDLRGQGRRGRRLPDAHQPLDARAVRARDRGDRADRPRGRRHALLRRREPERDHGHLPAGRHGLRHRPLQPAQVVHPAPRRRRPGRRPGRGVRADRAVPAAAAGRPPRVERRTATRAVLRPRLRPAEVDRAPARLPGQLRRVRPLLRLHPLARRGRAARGLRGRGAERQLPARAAAPRGRGGVPAGRLRPAVHARVRALGRADAAASCRSRRSTWPSGCSTTASIRRPSTSR